jgi:hypothetical protein
MQGMHPFGEIVEILAVLLPLQLPVTCFFGPPLGQLLADPQPAHGWVGAALRFPKTADPSGPGIVAAMSAKYLVDLIDQAKGQGSVDILPCPFMEFQKIADCKGIGPQVAPRRAISREPGVFGKLVHNFHGTSNLSVLFHDRLPTKRVVIAVIVVLCQLN